MNAKTKKIILTILKNILAWIFSLIMLIPLLLIVINAFKPDSEALTLSLTLPKIWEFSNFAVVIEKGKLGTSFLNSLLYAGCATVITVILASMAAYVLARRRGKADNRLYMYMVLGIVIPINYVSLMKVMQVTQLNDTRLGIILLYVAMQLPFSVFLLYGFVSKVPVDLDEAAVLDGCGPWRLFFNIVMPMMKSSMVTAAVLCFLNTWNASVFPEFFRKMADDTGCIQFLRTVFKELEPDLCGHSSDLSAGYHYVSGVPEAYRRRTDRRSSKGLMPFFCLI